MSNDLPWCTVTNSECVWKTIEEIELDPTHFSNIPTCGGHDVERQYYGRIGLKQECLNCHDERFIELKNSANIHFKSCSNIFLLGIILGAIIGVLFMAF